MKNIFMTIALVGTVLFTASCREKKTETTEVIREVRVESNDDEPERESILERTAKEVDKEVNEEIDRKIKEIGNDDN